MSDPQSPRSVSATSRRAATCLAGLILASCAGPPSVAPSASPPPRASHASDGPSAAPLPIDLGARSPIWFAPLPPMPTDAGRPYIGSEDFMDLFNADAAWDAAASEVGVFKLYGEWVAYHATDAQLRTAVQDIARRGLVLAVEMGPLDPPEGCGQGVEGFAGTDEGRLISRRIRDAGGVLDVVALDEPYYFAHLYDGPNACRWSVDEVAAGVRAFRDVMRAEWPAVLIGDTEPMPPGVTPDGLAAWLDAYREAAGEPFAFLHLDMDWSIDAWPQLGVAVEAVGDAREVPIGMIYNGGSASSDGQWLAITGSRVAAYELVAAARPDHVLFQSWMDKPDRVLPETDASTFTWLINRYVNDRDSMADLSPGPENVALGRPVTASSSLVGSSADRATDGNPDAIWNSGGPPPAWVEIDLGQAFPVTEVRLLVAQSPAGPTTHHLGCRGSPSGAIVMLGTLQGSTTDGDLLSLELGSPTACRILRVDTSASPSWVAWRDIEVSVAED